VLVADMVIPACRFDGKNMTTELYQPLVEKVEHLPEAQATSLTTAVPSGKSDSQHRGAVDVCVR
jgi:hypothetical protein